MTDRGRGFTIIETTLFVVVSALIFVAVLAGMGRSVQNNRITDTTRALEGFIEAQMSDVRAGTVSAQTNAGGKLTCAAAARYPGGSDLCMVIGKVMTFDTATGTLKTYNVVANTTPDQVGCTAPSATGAEALVRYCPQVLDVTQPIESYTVEWGATLASLRYWDGTTAQSFGRIAILRDPESEIVYVVDIGGAFPATGSYALDSAKLVNTASNQEANICINHATFPVVKTSVHFTGGEGTGALETSGDNVGTRAQLAC